MRLFHMMLTLSCPHCRAQLVRVAPSEYLDLAVCPRCLAAGPYDAVVEEGSELTPGRVLPSDVADYVRGLHTSQ
jgi:phage FluMu protein Com